MADIITPKTGAYIPPHLRDRPSPSPSSSSPSNHASTSYSAQSPRGYSSSPSRFQRSGTADSDSQAHVRRPLALTPARTPVTAGNTLGSSSKAYSLAPAVPPISTEKYRAPGMRSIARSSPPPSDIFAPARPKSVTPHGVYGDRFCDFHIYGDSFVGPFSLLRPNSVYIRKFKGASAKGLNNAKSFKRVALELVPELNGAMAEGPRSDTKLEQRNSMLMFGNVDLQINYLYQLQNRPLTDESFVYTADLEQIVSAVINGETKAEAEYTVDTLANATETSTSGPAFGPERFVEECFKAYATFIKKNIIEGVVGDRIRRSATERKPTGKILIAGALPPLIEDSQLSVIPEKYVVRLESEHKVTQRQFEEDTRQVIPSSPTSSASSRISTPIEAAASAPCTPPSSCVSSPRVFKSTVPHRRKAVYDLLHFSDVPLCDLSTRISMTLRWNALLSLFCAEFPDILTFVDIGPSMVLNNPTDFTPRFASEVGRSRWADAKDPTNIHPSFEQTLPLWMAELTRHGMDTSRFEIVVDLQLSARRYEDEKEVRYERASEERRLAALREGLDASAKMADEQWEETKAGEAGEAGSVGEVTSAMGQVALVGNI